MDLSCRLFKKKAATRIKTYVLTYCNIINFSNTKRKTMIFSKLECNLSFGTVILAFNFSVFCKTQCRNVEMTNNIPEIQIYRKEDE